MRLTPIASLILIAALGCGSNPSAPDADFAGPGPSASGANGATLRGTFRNSAGTLRASRAGNEDSLIVIAFDENGKEITRVNVVNGSFTLRGLPDDFTLEFWDGNTRVGRENFEGVKPNQELDVVLSYDGASVSLLNVQRTGIDHQPGDGIELEGTASAVNDSGPAPWDGSLMVDGYDVGIRVGQTSIREGNQNKEIGDLDGRQVHVRGVFERVNGSDMWVFAHEIKLQDEEDPASGGKVTLCHIPPGNPENAKTKSVSADAVAAHLAHGDYLGPCK